MSQVSRRSAMIGAGAALTVASCGGDERGEGTPRARGTSARPVEARHARPLTVTQTAAERRRTADSLRRLDSHPMYALEWSGAASAVDPATTGRAAPTAERSTFGCTLFVARGASGEPLVGRNFDWDPNPAAVVRSRVRGGPRSLSVSDLSFIGYPTAEVGRLQHDDGRAELTRVQAAVVDGVNEHGLFIGLAADDGAAPPADRGRQRVGGISVQRLVLDHARTVDQAVALMGRYDLDFSGGPPLHYLLADRSGDSAVVEIHRGALTRVPPLTGERWQVLENFHLSGVPTAKRASFARYSTCARALERADGRLTEASARRLMKSVQQQHTQWTAIYDLAGGSLAVFTGGTDRAIHRFRL